MITHEIKHLVFSLKIDGGSRACLHTPAAPGTDFPVNAARRGIDMCPKGHNGILRTCFRAFSAKNATVFIYERSVSHHEGMNAVFTLVQFFDLGIAMNSNRGMFSQSFDVRP
jgi:hypothetical protein